MPHSRGTVLGLDIGGANLKAAHSDGPAVLRPFELWKNPTRLTTALRDLLRDLPTTDAIAVTMTGELCDCFATRRDGVLSILDSLAAATSLPCQVWRNDGRFVDLDAARTDPLPVAAANWLALATFVGQLWPDGPALLLDVGSTTTDIIPIHDSKPVPRGRTDFERLRSRELVYTGIRRTPVCALLGAEGAAEWFATTLDVYLLLGELPENLEDHGTADGRAASLDCAHARLARMVGADVESLSLDEARRLAQAVADRQAVVLASALTQVVGTLPAPPGRIILSGSGEFLARRALRRFNPELAAPVVALSDSLGPVSSGAACAVAVSRLAVALVR